MYSYSMRHFMTMIRYRHNEEINLVDYMAATRFRARLRVRYPPNFITSTSLLHSL